MNLTATASKGGPADSAAACSPPMQRSVYRGVCWNRRNQGWQATLHWASKYLYLGCHTKELDAARIFDAAAVRLRGPDKARLNFPAEDYIDSETGEFKPDAHIDALLAAASGVGGKRRRRRHLIGAGAARRGHPQAAPTDRTASLLSAAELAMAADEAAAPRRGSANARKPIRRRTQTAEEGSEPPSPLSRGAGSAAGGAAAAAVHQAASGGSTMPEAAAAMGDLVGCRSIGTDEPAAAAAADELPRRGSTSSTEGPNAMLGPALLRLLSSGSALSGAESPSSRVASPAKASAAPAAQAPQPEAPGAVAEGAADASPLVGKASAAVATESSDGTAAAPAAYGGGDAAGARGVESMLVRALSSLLEAKSSTSGQPSAAAAASSLLRSRSSRSSLLGQPSCAAALSDALPASPMSAATSCGTLSACFLGRELRGAGASTINSGHGTPTPAGEDNAPQPKAAARLVRLSLGDSRTATNDATSALLSSLEAWNQQQPHVPAQGATNGERQDVEQLLMRELMRMAQPPPPQQQQQQQRLQRSNSNADLSAQQVLSLFGMAPAPSRADAAAPVLPQWLAAALGSPAADVPPPPARTGSNSSAEVAAALAVLAAAAPNGTSYVQAALSAQQAPASVPSQPQLGVWHGAHAGATGAGALGLGGLGGFRFGGPSAVGGAPGNAAAAAHDHSVLSEMMRLLPQGLLGRTSGVAAGGGAGGAALWGMQGMQQQFAMHGGADAASPLMFMLPQQAFPAAAQSSGMSAHTATLQRAALEHLAAALAPQPSGFAAAAGRTVRSCYDGSGLIGGANSQQLLSSAAEAAQPPAARKRGREEASGSLPRAPPALRFK